MKIDLFDSETQEYIHKGLESVKKQKEESTKDLKEATGDELFKHLILVNLNEIRENALITRRQALASFRLTKIVALIGFIILAGGSILGIYLKINDGDLSVAYITSISGIITEFISGIFFYIYNKTLQQLNLFHDKILAAQNVALSFFASSTISDKKMCDESKAALSKILMSSTTKSE